MLQTKNIQVLRLMSGYVMISFVRLAMGGTKYIKTRFNSIGFKKHVTETLASLWSAPNMLAGQAHPDDLWQYVLQQQISEVLSWRQNFPASV